MANKTINFGPFRLTPEQRMLMSEGKPVRIGSRALDILIALSERAGQTISNRELVKIVWPDTVVEEANLRVHISALRKALGDSGKKSAYVANVPGRGYAFVAGLLPDSIHAGLIDTSAVADRRDNLPAMLTPMVGRDDASAAINLLMAEHSLVTIVGPGGIGKTTVALSVAAKLAPRFRDRVVLVDLASLPETGSASSVLAAVLGAAVYSDDPLPGLVAFLRERQMLVVLDNCEHVIQSAAELAEALIIGAAEIRVLATSREALRAQGEWQYRLTPLNAPPVGTQLSAMKALEYSAVRLFIDRAIAKSGSFEFVDADVAVIADLCRQLDGLPLALELAAANVDLFGLHDLAGRLDDRLALLTRGRRTALPRHKTIRATLDWSYDVLTSQEQKILRRISVFAGRFNMQSAEILAADDSTSPAQVREGLANLVAKSLVVAETQGDVTGFRLLQLARAYAREKLLESSDHAAVQRRHAEHVSEILREADKDWENRSTTDWLAAHGHRIDDVRAALNWALSSISDAKVGATLIAVSSVLWIELSLIEEYRRYIERALAALGASGQTEIDLEIQLNAALGNALFHTSGPTDSVVGSFKKALQLAEESGDIANKLKAFSGLCASQIGVGQYTEALSCAEKFDKALGVTPPATARVISNRLRGLSLSFSGDLLKAHELSELVYAEPVAAVHRTGNTGVQFDQRVAAGTLLARNLWLLGAQDRAMKLAEETVGHALCIEHAISLCYTLAIVAYPINRLSGDDIAADRYLSLLTEYSVKHSFVFWQSWAHGYSFLEKIRHREIEPQSLSSRQAWPPEFGLAVGPQLEIFGTLSEHFAALFAIDRAESGNAGWATAEILRAKGTVIQNSMQPTAATDAEAMFKKSLEVARAQHALAWEVRTAMSLASLWKDQGNWLRAKQFLQGILDRLDESRSEVSRVAARALLVELGSVEV